MCTTRLTLAFALLAPLGIACSSCHRSSHRAIERVAAAELRAHGISGVTRDDEGRFWAVSEERHELHRFAPTWDLGSRVRVPIAGIAPGLELESAAWLGHELLALGTETDDERDEDAILIVEVKRGAARVVSTSHLSWRSDLGVAAPHNAGIEGLCAAGGSVLAAGEMVIDRDGARLAPLARAPHLGAEIGEWASYELELTSETGKISALDCEDGPDGALVVHGVERHFGVTRVLRFDVPEAPPGHPIVPRVVADLSAMEKDLPNVEGLVVDGDRFVLLSDHDADQTEGTTEILSLTREAPSPTTTVLASLGL